MRRSSWTATRSTRWSAGPKGWAAGLQLAALTIKGRAAPSAAVDEIRGDNRHILDFFTSEVIGKLDQDQRDLLVRTSGLERLSGPLCDAVLGRSGSATSWRSSTRRTSSWFRWTTAASGTAVTGCSATPCSHQLEPEVSAEVLARAADWFYRQGFLDDAIALRIDAGAPQEAADLLRRAVPWFLEHGAGSILRLGNRLGLDTLRSDPGLCASLAWAAAVAGDFDQLGRWLDAAEPDATDDTEPPQGWHSLTGALSTLRALHLLVRSRGRRRPHRRRPRRGGGVGSDVAGLRPRPTHPRHRLPRR